jgi:hypothetical protein
MTGMRGARSRVSVTIRDSPATAEPATPDQPREGSDDEPVEAKCEVHVADARLRDQSRATRKSRLGLERDGHALPAQAAGGDGGRRRAEPSRWRLPRPWPRVCSSLARYDPIRVRWERSPMTKEGLLWNGPPQEPGS